MGALLLPAAAGAATKTVSAGTPPKGLLPGLPPSSFDNAFYPKRTSIKAGDSVKFDVLGFHNVMSVPKGQDAPPFVVPGAGVSGVTRRQSLHTRAARWAKLLVDRHVDPLPRASARPPPHWQGRRFRLV